MADRTLVIKVERIYNNPKGNDAFRILVDKFWPRGLSKDKVKIDLWQKDIAPSDSLRKWFSHDKEKWDEFRTRYFRELKEKSKSIDLILDKVKEGPVTLLFGTREEEFNNAVALREYLLKK